MGLTDEVERRSRWLRRIRRRLERRSVPRLQMGLIVAATGCSGFFAAVVLLRLGVDSMWLRYGLAVVVSFVVFLVLVWGWLFAVRRRSRLELDLLDSFGGDAPAEGPGAEELIGGGGDFGGGGASSSYESPKPSVAEGPSGHGGGTDLDLSGDELFLLLAFLAAVLSAVIAAIYLVATAPAFFAEIVLDGALSAGLYRRLRRIGPRHWMETAISRTIGPFLAVLLFFVLAGAIMQEVAPEVRTIGDAWAHWVDGPAE